MSQKIYSCDMCAIKSTTQIPCEHPFCEMVKLLPDEENTGAHSYTESAYKEFEGATGIPKERVDIYEQHYKGESPEPQENLTEALALFLRKLSESQKDMPPDIAKLVNDNFDELIEPVSAPSESHHLDKLVALREFIESKINRFVYWDEENKKWFESDQKAASESQEEMWSDVISEARFYDGSPHDLKSMIKYMEKRFTITRKP